MSVKEQVLQAISRLPDDIDYRDVTDEIAFLAAMREAEQDIQNGRLVSNEPMKTRIVNGPENSLDGEGFGRHRSDLSLHRAPRSGCGRSH